MSHPIRLPALCAAAALALAACAAHKGEDLPTPNVALGQQVQDLRNAYLNGNISRQDYERQREILTNH